MTDIETLIRQPVEWDLDNFVREVNARLPAYLPTGTANTKLREEVTPRLVRHYATLGSLDEPRKEGREARYTPRHLLQMLVVRRLLAEGFSSGALSDSTRRRTDEELLAMLRGGAVLEPSRGNPALDFLDELRGFGPSALAYSYAPTPSPTAPAPGKKGSEAQAPPPVAERWRRAEIAPGLELHVRDDFRFPKTPDESETLMDKVRSSIQEIRRSKR